MKITIVGAGEVGLHLAHVLTEKGHDITLIESDEALEESLPAFVPERSAGCDYW